MNRTHTIRFARTFLCIALATLALACTSYAPLPNDYTGDWHGVRRSADGAEAGAIAAQVIALGKGTYQANILEAFDTRTAPIAVLQGKLEGDKLVFGKAASIENDRFAGTIKKGGTQAFEMQRVTRLSPTLGLNPPKGAIVLFGGVATDEWKHTGFHPGAVDLAREVGGTNCVAYLRANVTVDATQDAVLGIGSDDGVKVWLNGKVVHTNNVSRGVVPDQDKVNVTLKKANRLMLKVMQGAGGWGACARLLSTDGGQIAGAKAGTEGTEMTPLAASQGFISRWDVSAPHTMEGKDGLELVDVAFAPETDASGSADWRVIDLTAAPEGLRWNLVDNGAMEVTPKTASILTNRQFGDCSLHIEFRTPFMPEARGQGRGNSGVYMQARYEVQILDSYGLEGLDNECGGIYKVSAPRVNMCAPPMQWQTYDVDFRGPRHNAAGEKTEHARITVRHNGVLIHEDLDMPGPTGVAGGAPEPAAGPILLQDHHNPVQFRNIWVVER